MKMEPAQHMTVHWAREQADLALQSGDWHQDHRIHLFIVIDDLDFQMNRDGEKMVCEFRAKRRVTIEISHKVERGNPGSIIYHL